MRLASLTLRVLVTSKDLDQLINLTPFQIEQ